MIRAVIIDDELPCINALTNDLRMFCPQVQILASCNTAKDGLLAIRELKPELVFLDVDMPLLNGFELLNVIGEEVSFHVIFTTAYHEYATRAFRVSALDYLLKPIDPDELQQAVEKALKTITIADNRISNLLENERLTIENQKIAISTRSGFEYIPASQIIYCRADGAYTWIYVDDEQGKLISKSLGQMETILPPEFFERIHHSCIINLNYVSGLKKGDNMLVKMKDGAELPVSRSRKSSLLIRLEK